jgi:hypothetical protein
MTELQICEGPVNCEALSAAVKRRGRACFGLADSSKRVSRCHMEQYRQDLGEFDELKTIEQFST